jgi:hypothetical protein
MLKPMINTIVNTLNSVRGPNSVLCGTFLSGIRRQYPATGTLELPSLHSSRGITELPFVSSSRRTLELPFLYSSSRTMELPFLRPSRGTTELPLLHSSTGKGKGKVVPVLN